MKQQSRQSAWRHRRAQLAAQAIEGGLPMPCATDELAKVTTAEQYEYAARRENHLAQHPDYAGTSVRVVGTYNGTPFVYTTAVTAVQHVEFDPPLVVGGGGANFTLFVDLTSWFRTAAGSLVDPATAIGDGANVALVTQNIIHSFHAFEDDDHDGHDDQTEVEMH